MKTFTKLVLGAWACLVCGVMLLNFGLGQAMRSGGPTGKEPKALGAVLLVIGLLLIVATFGSGLIRIRKQRPPWAWYLSAAAVTLLAYVAWFIATNL